MGDVNDLAKQEWKTETTPFERVQSILTTMYEGESASEIAERALVSENTARKHLETLVDEGYVETTATPDRTATLYRRSKQSLILEEATDMLRRADRAELTRSVGEMEATLESFRRTYGAETPEEAVLEGEAVDEADLLEWRTTRRNLSFARVALALSMAEREVMPDQAV